MAEIVLNFIVAGVLLVKHNANELSNRINSGGCDDGKIIKEKITAKKKMKAVGKKKTAAPVLRSTSATYELAPEMLQLDFTFFC